MTKKNSAKRASRRRQTEKYEKFPTPQDMTLELQGHAENLRVGEPATETDRIVQEVLGESNIDPAMRIEGMPANMGKPLLPHVITFTGIISTISKVYRPSDEALRHSWENARYMLMDCSIQECLEQRMRSTALLNWHLECDDENDPQQMALVDAMTDVVKQTPRFMQYRESLLKALWFGKYANKHVFGRKKIKGVWRHVVQKWEPTHGDKLVFRYDTGTGDYDPDQVGIRVGAGFQSLMARSWQQARMDQIQICDIGLAYFMKPEERNLLCIHKHMVEDGEWEDVESAGRIHGVGIRHRIYWTWVQMQEALAWLMEFLERSAFGMEIWYYPWGNSEARNRMYAAAKDRIGQGRNIVLVPRPEGETAQAFGVERIEPAMAGADVLKDIITNLFGHRIKRYILGQTLTSEAGSTGLGSNLASVHLDTYLQIVRYDAQNLEETLTKEFLDPLKFFNFPAARDVPIHFKIDTEAQDVEAKLAGWRQAWEMGARLSESEVMDLIGANLPGKDDIPLINPQILQAQMQMDQMAQQQAAMQQQAQAQQQMAQQQQAALPQPPPAEQVAPQPPEQYSLVGLRERIEAAAARTDRNPSAAAKKAGNYEKGRVWIQGMEVAIENPRGSTRSGRDEDGQSWSVVMPHHYGYIKQTESEADGDHVDVFVGPHPESQIVFVIDQLSRGGYFDEHKCMLGFTNEQEALKAYRAAYNIEPNVGGVRAMTMAQFRTWLAKGDTGRRITEQKKYALATEPEAYAAGEVIVEATHGVPEYDAHNDRYKDPPFRFYKEYDRGTHPTIIENDLIDFYRKPGAYRQRYARGETALAEPDVAATGEDKPDVASMPDVQAMQPRAGDPRVNLAGIQARRSQQRPSALHDVQEGRQPGTRRPMTPEERMQSMQPGVSYFQPGESAEEAWSHVREENRPSDWMRRTPPSRTWQEEGQEAGIAASRRPRANAPEASAVDSEFRPSYRWNPQTASWDLTEAGQAEYNRMMAPEQARVAAQQQDRALQQQARVAARREGRPQSNEPEMQGPFPGSVPDKPRPAGPSDRGREDSPLTQQVARNANVEWPDIKGQSRVQIDWTVGDEDNPIRMYSALRDMQGDLPFVGEQGIEQYIRETGKPRPTTYDFVFRNVDVPHDEGFSVTGTGHAKEAMIGAASHILSALKQFQPGSLSFSASGPGRVRAYEFMAKRLKRLIDYKVFQYNDSTDRQGTPKHAYFFLVRPDLVPFILSHASDLAGVKQYAAASNDDDGEDGISAEGVFDLLPGGPADGMPDSEFPKKELERGRKEESEHTDNSEIAGEIAKDHLVEGKHYSADQPGDIATDDSMGAVGSLAKQGLHTAIAAGGGMLAQKAQEVGLDPGSQGQETGLVKQYDGVAGIQPGMIANTDIVSPLAGLAGKAVGTQLKGLKAGALMAGGIAAHNWVRRALRHNQQPGQQAPPPPPPPGAPPAPGQTSPTPAKPVPLSGTTNAYKGPQVPPPAPGQTPAQALATGMQQAANPNAPKAGTPAAKPAKKAVPRPQTNPPVLAMSAEQPMKFAKAEGQPGITLGTAKAGDGIRHGIYLGQKRLGSRIGHISGFHNQTARDVPGREGEAVPVFDVWNTELNQEHRGKGLYQEALQQVADTHGTLRIPKFQASPALQKAIRKMPTHTENEKNLFVAGGQQEPEQYAAGSSDESDMDRSYREWEENADRVSADPHKASDKDLLRALGYQDAVARAYAEKIQAGHEKFRPHFEGHSAERDWYRDILTKRERGELPRPEQYDKAAEWKTLGGGSPALVSSDGSILEACPGLEGENVGEIGRDEDPENRARRDHRKAVAKSLGLTGRDLTPKQTKALEKQPHPETGEVASGKQISSRTQAKRATAIDRDRQIDREAKRNRIEPADLRDAIAMVLEGHSGVGDVENEARNQAMRSLGLHGGNLAFLENRGFDHSSQIAMERVGRNLAREYPGLGWGSPEAPKVDFGAALWDLIRNGSQESPEAYDPEVIEAAVNMVRSAQDHSDVEQPWDAETVPFSKRSRATPEQYAADSLPGQQSLFGENGPGAAPKEAPKTAAARSGPTARQQTLFHQNSDDLSGQQDLFNMDYRDEGEDGQKALFDAQRPKPGIAGQPLEQSPQRADWPDFSTEDERAIEEVVAGRRKEHMATDRRTGHRYRYSANGPGLSVERTRAGWSTSDMATPEAQQALRDTLSVAFREHGWGEK